MGFTTVTTGASGNASFLKSCAAIVTTGELITATATDLATNDTSEFSATRASAAALFVDTTSDTVDGTTTSIANLLAAKGIDGKISLREAIIATNNTAGADTIFLPAGSYVLSRTGASEDAASTGDLDITGNLTIAGAGANTTFIDGAATDRVFDVLSGTVAMSGLTIHNSNAFSDWGGGVKLALGATLTLQDAALSGNVATKGGAIYASGTVILDRVSIESNTAVTGAGLCVDNFGTAALTNVTISGNVASGMGGAIYATNSVNITSSTIADNSATGGGGGINCAGRRQCHPQEHHPGLQHRWQRQRGPLTSLGYNVDSANTAGLTGPGDQINTNPLLGPLQYNGGTTKTYALLSGSPAINAGTATGAPATDQRGVNRLGTTDIGAYEYTVIGYEPFAYATGSFNGANGGSGWATPWGNAGTNTTIVATGLQNPTVAMPVSGGTARLAMSLPTAMTQTRDLTTTLGADGTTTWLSFLIKPGTTTLGDYVGMEFGSTSATVAFAGYNNNAFVLEVAGGAGSVQVSGITPLAGQTYLLTVKIDFAAGVDAMTLYVNPTPGLASPDSTFTAVKNNIDLGTFTRLGLAGGRLLSANNAALDEIRIASSYFDVAPASQPPQSAPVLDPTASPTLVAVDEDAGVPVGVVGTPIFSLVDFLGGGGLENVTDADGGAFLGIAVTAANTTNGTWYYTIDGGTNWNALGAVAGNNARAVGRRCQHAALFPAQRQLQRHVGQCHYLPRLGPNQR